MDQKLALLARVPLLAGLDRKHLEEVGRLADEVDLPAGKSMARSASTGTDSIFATWDLATSSASWR